MMQQHCSTVATTARPSATQSRAVAPRTPRSRRGGLGLQAEGITSRMGLIVPSASGNSLSASRMGNSLSVGSGRSRTIPAKASSGTDGNNLSMSRDGNGMFIGSQRSGGGGGRGVSGGGGGGKGGSGSGGSSGAPSGDGSAHPMRLWTFVFAAALAAGGAMAYFRKGSTKSLGASLSASFILLLCARSMVGASAGGAARVAFGLTLLLGIAMVNRFTKTKKVMPAGLVAGSSLCMAMGFLLTGL